jgi:putative ABC transport system substrate-binding protein
LTGEGSARTVLDVIRWLLAMACLVGGGELAARPATAQPRVGIITAAPAEQPLSANSAALVQGLREAGFVDGQTVVLDWRFAANDPARFTELATDFVRAKVDLIVARGPDSLRAAWQATRSIPIVALDFESDPVASGFAASVARPGGNVTGIFLDQPELGGKLLEVAREALPGLRRAAVFWVPLARPQLRATEAAARVVGVELQSLPLQTPQEIAGAFDAAVKARAQALIFLSAPLMNNQRQRLADLARAHRLPSIGVFPAFADAGGLLAYGPSQVDLFARLGVIAGKVLRGARPADLPIERPARFDLVVNLKTARALGLTIPQPVVLRATRIIE